MEDVMAFSVPHNHLGVFTGGKYSVLCNTTEASGGRCDVKYQVMFGSGHPGTLIAE